MKKAKYLLILLLLPFLSFVLFACNKTLKIEKTDKTLLIMKIEEIKKLRNPLIVGATNKFKGYRYISKDANKKINEVLDGAINIYLKENATDNEIDEQIILLNEKKAILESIKTFKKDDVILDKKTELIATLKLIDDDKFPQSYYDFYNEYLKEQEEVLKDSQNFDDDFKIIQTRIKNLQDYMRLEIWNLAKYNEEYDFCNRKNPFKSCHPKFEYLPDENEIFVHVKGESRDLLKEKGVKAYDVKRRDLSSRIYFKQTSDLQNTSRQIVQIACFDDYGNETVSVQKYILISHGTLTDKRKPNIVVPTKLDITSSAAIKSKNIKDYVIATDYLGVRIKNENIIFKAYYKNGLEAVNFFETGEKEPGFYTITFQARDNDNNYTKVVRKELIILPPSEAFKSSKKEVKSDIEPKDYALSIDNLSSFEITDDSVYKYKSNTLLAQRSHFKVNVNPNAVDKKVILFDEVKQYIDLCYKQTGFNQMTYNLMQYIDAIVVWNNLGDISLPSKDIIDLFHRNGVKVYGAILIDWEVLGGSSDTLDKLIEKDEQGNFLNTTRLSNISKEFGFDGWFLSLKTGFYKVPDDISKLSMVEKKEFYEKREKATKKTNEYLIPFLKELKDKLNFDNNKLLLSEGVADDGGVSITQTYKSIHKEIAKACDIFITSHEGSAVEAGGVLPSIEEEISNYQQDTGKEKDSFYKSIFAGYNKREAFNLGDYEKILDSNNKLLTNIFVVNLCYRLFNLRNSSFNYGKLLPSDPMNLNGSNDYYEYIKRLQEITDAGNFLNERTKELKLKLSSLSTEEKKTFDRSVYFNFAEHIIGKTTIQGDAFYSNFNQANGISFSKDSIINKDFRNNKTFLKDGGYNNFEMQSILPHWNTQKTNNLNDLAKLFFDFDNVDFGLSSLRIKGMVKKSSKAVIDLFATNLIYNNVTFGDYVYKIEFKNNSIKPYNLKLLVINIDGMATEVVSGKKTVNQNQKDKIEFILPTTIKNITKLSLVIETEEINYMEYDLNIFNIFVGKKSLLSNQNEEISEIKIKNKGFDDNIKADLLLEYSKVSNAKYYIAYQVKKDNSLLFLGFSRTTNMIAKGIMRFAENPLNSSFPTLDEYDNYSKNFKIVIIAYGEYGNVIAKKEKEDDDTIWPRDLNKGGIASVKLSSKIAKVNERIIVSPVLADNIEEFEFEFYEKPGQKNHNLLEVKKIAGTNSYVLRFYEEGFYGFRYTSKNPYGEDFFEIEKGIIISNDVEAESDITGDSMIDDSDDKAGINYSPGIPNSSERPSFLIDRDVNGNPNLGTKWCNTSKAPGARWVIIEFLAEVSVSRFQLSHCTVSLTNSWDRHNRGAITAEYEIYVSTDRKTWTKVVHRENNTKDVTTDKLEEAVICKYIKLNVVNGGQDITARIYDLRIFGSR